MIFGGEFLRSNICLICQKPTENNLMRQAFLLRQGVLDPTAGPLRINRYLCRKCLIRLPVLFREEARRVENPTVEIKSAFAFSHPIDFLIRALKFQQKCHYAEILADLMYLVLAKEFLPADSVCRLQPILIPVPLAAGRKKERGYNQAELIAQRLADNLSFTCRSDLLQRGRDTKRQTETKNRAERVRNVQNAFSLVKNSDTANELLCQIKAEHQKVFLIDDVTTSGMTLKEAALPLLRQGIEVSCFTAAKEMILSNNK